MALLQPCVQDESISSGLLAYKIRMAKFWGKTLINTKIGANGIGNDQRRVLLTGSG
jgi:hypothetical protein